MSSAAVVIGALRVKIYLSKKIIYREAISILLVYMRIYSTFSILFSDYCWQVMERFIKANYPVVFELLLWLRIAHGHIFSNVLYSDRAPTCFLKCTKRE